MDDMDCGEGTKRISGFEEKVQNRSLREAWLQIQ